MLPPRRRVTFRTRPRRPEREERRRDQVKERIGYSSIAPKAFHAVFVPSTTHTQPMFPPAIGESFNQIAP